MHTHTEDIHSNLLAHAKKKAKKLFKLAQTRNFNLQITSLSQAQEVLAQINGYENWHILEKVVQEKQQTHQKNKHTSLLHEITGQNKEELIVSDLYGYNFIEKDFIYTVIALDNFEFENYGEIFEALNNEKILPLVMALDREFSVFSLNLFYHDYQQNINPVASLIPQVQDRIGFSDYLQKMFKINALNFKVAEENAGSFKLTGLLTLKTDKRVQKEHNSFLQELLNYLKGFAHVTIVNDLATYLEIETYQLLKGHQPIDSTNVEDSLTKQIKQIQNLQDKSFNWSMVFSNEKDKPHFLASVYVEVRDEMSTHYLLNGYQKELSKYSHSDLKMVLASQPLKFSYHANLNQNSMENPGNHILFGRPGSGKSVLMNYLNLKNIIGNGSKNVPHLGIIDIGPSSKGLIHLIRNNLPEEKKHLAQYYRFAMTEEFCVNVFDTQLGARFPSSAEKVFLHNFILLLLTDPNTKEIPPGIAGFVQTIIEESYLKCADSGLPKKYNKCINTQVDMAVENTGMLVDKKTTWWEVVDNLFVHARTYEAMLAQRYAVPLLVDLIFASQSEKIRANYNAVTLATGETVIDYFKRVITGSLNQYKVLSRPTVFDTGHTRIISIDLDQVCKTGGPIAEQQTAVMYMVARYIAGKNMKINWESVENLPYPAIMQVPDDIPSKQYKIYHMQKIEGMKEDLKSLCFDELHRVSSFPIVLDQVVLDMRESRKWNIENIIGSQSLKDFNATMLSFCHTVFILDSGNARDREEIKSTFNLHSAKEIKWLDSVHGPRPGKGSHYLMKSFGKESALINIKLSNELIWAFSTTFEDVMLRDMLVEKTSYQQAINLLSEHYPYGIKKEVEKRKENMVIPRNDSGLEDTKIIIEQIFNELLTKI